MIRFFRTLRQKLLSENRVSKYLLYAFGEIVLVVIGILIALQVNTWNETRREQKIIHSVLVNLKMDVEEDLASLKQLRELLSRRKENATTVLQALEHPDSVKNARDLTVAMTRAGWILNYTPAFATYNEIMNSGRLSLITSADLKKAMADYKSQIDDNQRIEAAYEPGLKEAERILIGSFSTVPEPTNLLTPIPESFDTLKVDLSLMSKKENLLQLLKHIQYFTAMEIRYKDNLIVPKAENIRHLLDTELMKLE